MAQKKETAKKTTAKKVPVKKAPAKKAPKKPAGLAPEPEQKDYTPEFVAKGKARAETGDAEGQAIYGRALCNGWGVEVDYDAALRWLRKAAEAGNASGQTSLGGMYLLGYGVPKDEAEAAKWIRKAAEKGLPRAQSNLGSLYITGKCVPKDEAKAAKWFRKAAEQGFAVAQCFLGICYDNGEGVEKDPAKAAEWYRKAAEQGLPRAQCNLGVCYENGVGVEKDLAKAEEWFRKAAEQRSNQKIADKAKEHLNSLTRKTPAEQDGDQRIAVETTTIALPGDIELAMVRIPGEDYRMGKFPVTQAQWEAVMGENPSEFKGAENPVETVSWDDCQAFLEKLNAQPAAKASGLVFRLPEEDEWEYACRAGAEGDYCKLADGTEITEWTLGEVAWFDDNAYGTTYPVGQKMPNAFGLYDMHGNVWEWTATAEGKYRVLRGGCFYNTGDNLTASDRREDDPDCRERYIGFRLCASDRKKKAGIDPAVVEGIIASMVPIPGTDYRMGKFPVTQAQWEAMTGKNPSKFKGAENPVECVSRDDCDKFLKKLNALPAVQASGLVFRLPEADEWEYACRAGATGDYCKLADGTEITEETLGEVAWFGDESDDGTHRPVGQKKPNAFGLHDMLGNVWEWMADVICDVSSGTLRDGDGVVRGGSWMVEAMHCALDSSPEISTSSRINEIGFRLCADRRAD